MKSLQSLYLFLLLAKLQLWDSPFTLRMWKNSNWAGCHRAVLLVGVPSFGRKSLLSLEARKSPASAEAPFRQRENAPRSGMDLQDATQCQSLDYQDRIGCELFWAPHTRLPADCAVACSPCLHSRDCRAKLTKWSPEESHSSGRSTCRASGDKSSPSEATDRRTNENFAFALITIH